MTRNKILAIAFFLTCCMVETPRLAAQNVANWGLSHPQDVKTLPRSKGGAVIKPTVKEQTKIDAKLEKVGNNDYLLSQGWRMCSGRDVITRVNRFLMPMLPPFPEMDGIMPQYRVLC